jgi:amino acid adenylation domain-containing protein
MDQANALRATNGRERTTNGTGSRLGPQLSTVESSNQVIGRGANYPLASAIAERVAENTGEVVSLSRLSESERCRILYDWNETQADFPADKCVHEMFEEQVARTPNQTAVVFEGASIPYAELNRRANQLAHHLVELGVKPDARVAICLERSIDMVVALLGVLKAGGAYVPLDPAYPVDRLRYMLEDSAPVALLTQNHLAGLFSELNRSLPVLDMAAQPWRSRPETNPDRADRARCPSDLVYVIYTSGSTGKPKGVMVEHRSLVNRLVWMQCTYRLDARDSVLQKTPFSFDVSVWEFFWPLLVGARLVMARPEGHKDPAYLVQAISRYKITTLHFVPSMLQVFLEQADRAQCPTITRVVSSGEALPAALAQRFHQRLPQAALYNLYGPTETTVDVTAWTCRPDSTLSFVPIGRPIANTRAYILDSGGEPVPVGEAGELFIGGVGVARGYLNRPELTAERFLSDPFATEAEGRMYRTGDLCRWLPDGNIEYLGRNDFQVKIRGFRIELGEIEARLAQHPGVREAVVTAREDMPGDKRLVAYLVPAAGRRSRDRDLRDFLGRHLPDYMIPSIFIPMERMPVTANGKLDRSALPAPRARNQLRRELTWTPRKATDPYSAARPPIGPPIADLLRDGDYIPPSDPLEVELIEIWEETLGLAHIGVRDDFFQLGGHSLLAARMFARIAEKLEKNLPFATLFEGATIEKLAQVIRAEGWTSHWSVLVPIHEHGSKPPLFMVHGLDGNVLSFYGLRQHVPADQPLYGIQADGMDSGRASVVSIPDMARLYIKEVRSVQPHGPYFLGGFSAGGLVAYEMARQFEAEGEHVQFLALFDSYVEAVGGYWLKSFYSRRALKICMLALLASWHGVRKHGIARVFKSKVRSMGMNLRIMLWLALGNMIGKKKVGEDLHPDFLSPREAFTRAIRVYSPLPYSGSAVSFRGPTPAIATPDPADGWSKYISGKLEHQSIYGGHEDIFREPHISGLAGQLMQALEASYRDMEERQAQAK